MKTNQKKKSSDGTLKDSKTGAKPDTFHGAMKYLAEQADKKVKERQKSSK